MSEIGSILYRGAGEVARESISSGQTEESAREFISSRRANEPPKAVLLDVMKNHQRFLSEELKS